MRFFNFADKFENESSIQALERKKIEQGFSELVKQCMVKNPHERIRVEKIFEQEFFVRYIEFSAKSLKILPGKFAARLREMEEKLRVERVDTVQIHLLAQGIKHIVGKDSSSNDHTPNSRANRSLSSKSPMPKRRPLVIGKVISNQDLAFHMKRPIFQEIRPEGKLQNDMVKFDKDLRSGVRSTQMKLRMRKSRMTSMGKRPSYS